MKNLNIDGKWYARIDYHEYIANNLSQFGCAIFDSFDYPDFDFQILKKDLQLCEKALENMFLFPLIVYEENNKRLHTYWTFVNADKLSPFMFFDKVRLACGALHLGKFYACDFQSDKIYEMTPALVCEYGKLGELRKLFALDKGNSIVGKVMKWCGPIGYSRYYCQAKVFRNDAEQAFYAQHGKFMAQFGENKKTIDTFYSLDECKDKLDANKQCLEFENPTILEFDFDEPKLSVKATVLKAKNLNVCNLQASEQVFCGQVNCKYISSPQIFAQKIECESLNAEQIKTSFVGGLTFVNPNAKNVKSNLLHELKSLGCGFQEILVQSANVAQVPTESNICEDTFLFVNGLSKEIENKLKKDFDLQNVEFVKVRLRPDEIVELFATKAKLDNKKLLGIWQVERPRATYFHSKDDTRLLKIY